MSELPTAKVVGGIGRCLDEQNNYGSMLITKKADNSSYSVLLYPGTNYSGAMIENALDEKFQNINVYIAYTVSDLHYMFKDQDYDLLIINIDMIDDVTEEFIQETKAKKGSLPVMTYTESTVIPSTRRIHLFSLGVTFILDSPFTTHEFLAVVNNLIQLNDYYKGFEHAQNTIIALGRAVEARDPYTQGHGERVANIATKIFDDVGLRGNQRIDLYYGGILHDLGKIALPDVILNKNGKLSPDELELVRYHPVKGIEICNGIHRLKYAKKIISQHHERLDGSGYPYGLKEEDIDILSQITSVADVYDALTSDRSYRKAFSDEKAFEILMSDAKEKKLNEYFVNTLRRIVMQ